MEEENKKEEQKEVKENVQETSIPAEPIAKEPATNETEAKEPEVKPVEPAKNDAEVKKSEPAKEPKKKKKGLIIKIVILLILIIAIVASVLIYIFVFKKTTVDLGKYIVVTYDGYDGYGTIVSVELSKDLKDELDDSKAYKKLVSKFESGYEIVDEEDINGSLSNGDTIEIKAGISSKVLDEYKLELKETTITVTVEGLEEADVLDLADDSLEEEIDGDEKVYSNDDIEVTINGISPDLRATIKNVSSNDYIRYYVTYRLDTTYDIANGDTITVTASYSNDYALEQGYIIANDTLEIKVKGLPEYVDETDDLSDEIITTLETGITESLDDAIDSKVKSNFSSEELSAITISDPTLVAEYLITPDGTSYYYSNNNIFAGIYKVTATSSTTGETTEYYLVMAIYDLAIQDGELYDEDEIEVSCKGGEDTEDAAYDYYIDSYSYDYDIEEID